MACQDGRDIRSDRRLEQMLPDFPLTHREGQLVVTRTSCIKPFSAWIGRKPQLGDPKKPLQSLEAPRSTCLLFMETDAMTNKLVLATEDLTDLTGLCRPTAQMRWLKENGIVFLVGGDGFPKVLFDSVLNRFDKNLKNGNRRKKEPEVCL